MNAALVFSSLCLVVGGLLLAHWVLSSRYPALTTRLARAEGADQRAPGTLRLRVPVAAPAWLAGILGGYERDLRRAGDGKTLGRLLRGCPRSLGGDPQTRAACVGRRRRRRA
jgi:hypothetical protein